MKNKNSEVLAEAEVIQPVEANEKTNSTEFDKKESWLKRWFAPMKNKKPRTDKKFFGFMQQLGGTFMLPVAVLSIAGLFLGLGSGLQTIVTKEVSVVGYDILGFISLIGTFFFDMLPLAFTLAIPIGLCTGSVGYAAFAAAVSYFGTLSGMQFALEVLPENVKDLILNSGGVSAETVKLVKNIFGYTAMDMSILGAIINGIIVWQLHERLQYTKLPSGISFFGGKRLTPVICLLLFPTMGLIWVFIWPFVAKALYFVGIGLKHLGIFGPGLFIFISRLLCPTGLHHMLNALFNYTAVGGTFDFINEAGQHIAGEGNLNALRAYMANNMQAPLEYTMWLSGGYILPIVFGLPAAAVAMYLCAKKDSRPIVKAAILSGIIATAVGGITETIEFLFLFVAPLLYIFHAFMVGVGYIIFAALGVRVGQGGDLIVFIIYGPVQGLWTKWYWALVFGPMVSAIYFSVFYFSIKKFNVKTIGREDMVGTESEGGSKQIKDLLTSKNKKGKVDTELLQAQNVLKLVGGWENIAQLTNCFSRLRITLNNPTKITDAQVKEIGCVGLRTISETSYQIVVGAQVEVVRNKMEKLRGVTENVIGK